MGTYTVLRVCSRYYVRGRYEAQSGRGHHVNWAAKSIFGGTHILCLSLTSVADDSVKP